MATTTKTSTSAVQDQVSAFMQESFTEESAHQWTRVKEVTGSALEPVTEFTGTIDELWTQEGTSESGFDWTRCKVVDRSKNIFMIFFPDQTIYANCPLAEGQRVHIWTETFEVNRRDPQTGLIIRNADNSPQKVERHKVKYEILS